MSIGHIADILREVGLWRETSILRSSVLSAGLVDTLSQAIDRPKRLVLLQAVEGTEGDPIIPPSPPLIAIRFLRGKLHDRKVVPRGREFVPGRRRIFHWLMLQIGHELCPENITSCFSLVELADVVFQDGVRIGARVLRCLAQLLLLASVGNERIVRNIWAESKSGYERRLLA